MRAWLGLLPLVMGCGSKVLVDGGPPTGDHGGPQASSAYWLAYSVEYDGGTDVFAQQLDGEPVRLAEGISFFDVDWRPRGRSLLVSSFIALGESELMLVSPEQPGQFLGLASTTGEAEELMWSPKGDYISFFDAAGAYILSGDDLSLVATLPKPPSNVTGYLNWSPSDAHVAFARDVEGERRLFVAHAPDFVAEELPLPPDIEDPELTPHLDTMRYGWSPDGRYLAAHAERVVFPSVERTPVILVWDTEDGSVDTVSHPGDTAASWTARWSPDGGRLAYVESHWQSKGAPESVDVHRVVRVGPDGLFDDQQVATVEGSHDNTFHWTSEDTALLAVRPHKKEGAALLEVSLSPTVDVSTSWDASGCDFFHVHEPTGRTLARCNLDLAGYEVTLWGPGMAPTALATHENVDPDEANFSPSGDLYLYRTETEALALLDLESLTTTTVELQVVSTRFARYWRSDSAAYAYQQAPGTLVVRDIESERRIVVVEGAEGLRWRGWSPELP